MWKIFSASAQGPIYYNEGRNNQDAVISYVDDEVAISFICDGCHGGINSEVAARMSAPFLVRTSKLLLKDGCSLKDLPGQLFEIYLGYLVSQVEVQQFRTVEEKIDFIGSFMFCTVIGAIAYKGEVLLLNCGDGSYYLNNKVYVVRTSPNERPGYPSYNLYKTYGIIPPDATDVIDIRDGKSTKIPDGFEIIFLKESEVQLVGIASDGLNRLPKLYDELRAHATSQISLSLCLNRIAVVRGEILDNVTVSFLLKPKGG
ncbi:MAG: hypothetical protein UW68_C0004G0019 [Candidatus Collierbacteria bacterium GW2011_GWB1_44_6]|uniref:PPM-type phosphatase domain-containing protein n=2 Tax=Candidatus Collieribacteriota TaxID=1752725 RepID=A0A0G1LXW8_9BACT|nr:MAG: hypothetical protein UV68_C0047G0002 [Candidatus Collierbacteria bacterium GW2011_GWC2_43_12]KKT73662.1 MAG: hypothetical protein UW68_C0004G0019 [Candidatus Collierbacteria bacterium GW2011_GWB1_44_6]KKT83560.1 MAG: hypothetical protein UW80_C0011G0008 [Microgenomates group bacterium GW2011_GWC1_44_9]